MRLKKFNLPHFSKGRLKSILIPLSRHLHGEEISNICACLVKQEGGKRSSHWKLKLDNFRLGIRCKILSIKVINQETMYLGK